MKNKILFFLLFITNIISFSQNKNVNVNLLPTRYSSEEEAIVGHNLKRYNNRPLYCNNTNAFILAGDMPYVRFVRKNLLYGSLMLAIKREGKGKWFQECNDITSKYIPGQMVWSIKDSSFKGVTVTYSVIPMSDTIGMTVHVNINGACPGDTLIWAYGSKMQFGGVNLSWDFDVMAYPQLLNWGFNPDECKGNNLRIEKDIFFVGLPFDSLKFPKEFVTVVGKCSENSNIFIADASHWTNLSRFVTSKGSRMPIICGTVPLNNKNDIYWAIQPLLKEHPGSINRLKSPAETYNSALLHADSLKNRVIISTPDKRLNVLASAANIAIDGLWYPPVFHQGAMLWNLRSPGWRTISGGISYGWHDRVKEEAKFYVPFQVKKSNKLKAKTDTETLLTLQQNDSRFYGRGRIDKDQLFYNMQSQFFDQLITEWRWTADPELEKILRPALELHLEWLKECFDPDNDGVYESYLNTWSSDSQWYNGGGTAEETSYAYRAHAAARDMARHSKNKTAEKYHEAMMKKIKKGFFLKLWVKETGHSGSYREQSGKKRLHKDPSLYSIFLPIDADLVNKEQSVESLFYSEWALQNDRMPFGGRKVWTSNRVPGIWSVRELWPGDNYHLALAYFKTGMSEDGWDVFKGTFLQSAFDDVVPGNFSVLSGGTDYGDCSGMFCRTLVEGLFGFSPNYPNGVITIAPQFPVEWDSASIKTPDIVFQFNRNNTKITTHIELTRDAKIDIYLPINANKIKSAAINNKPVKWNLLPGFGKSLFHLQLSKRKKADLVIVVDKFIRQHCPVKLEGNVSDNIKITADSAKIIQYSDPQGTLKHMKIKNGIIEGCLAANPGYHTVFAKANLGNSFQWRIFQIKINDVVADSVRKSKLLTEVPVNPRWEYIDIGNFLKNDIRTIYQQKYFSPRPNTVSARIGTDGYSPWTFPFWNSKPPVIKLNLVPNLLDNSGHLVTSQNVPFIWGGEHNNVALTSLWDNFPKKVSIPVKKKGEALWLLISGSTNPMQCNIANAIVKMHYSDGKEESLELIPPINYWNLCAISSDSPAPNQNGRDDYTAEIDKFCLPKESPATIQLGENFRAMVLNWRLRSGKELESVTLETLSQEVVVGLMGLTIMNPQK